MNPIDPLVDGKGICNTIYKGPQDLLTSEGVGCGDLPVRFGADHEIMSFWKPDAEELALLNAGQVIYIALTGVQPPCSVGVTRSVTVKE